MVYQIVIASILGLILVNLILNLKSIRTPSTRARLPDKPPLISVLVPARNEENNIDNCLESLRSQDYPNFEVVVLDDNSVDNTAAIVAGYAQRDNRIRMIRGKPLPDEWAGKPFACQQLAEEAKGDWFLFVDADTVHASHMLRSVLALAMQLKTSMLSGFPRQLNRSLPQKIAVPLIYFVIVGWVPLWWIHRSRSKMASIAIGQFLFFSREEYWRIGGHEVVKARILDDIWMGIEVARAGGRHVAVDLSSVVFCDMYPTALAMWHGLVRCIYSVVAITPLLLFVLIFFATFVYIAPFYWLWNGFFMSPTPLIWRATVISQVVLILLIRWLIDARFKAPTLSVWLHPLGISYILIIVLYAAWRWWIGAGVSWKEREYTEEETVIK
ncbi:MAG TPA: glycosyltransferase [Dehalococcoidia bacterium]|nr:glycosyltransferase [Dehalococcoidia bacterium]